jgi:hypothetical protein
LTLAGGWEETEGAGALLGFARVVALTALIANNDRKRRRSARSNTGSDRRGLVEVWLVLLATCMRCVLGGSQLGS